MKNFMVFFTDDIEIPDVVNHKMEDAFATIRMEEKMSISNKNDSDYKKSRKVSIFKSQAAAVACVCILIFGSITAYAVCDYFWSRGMKGTLQATETQQQTLVEEGVATIFKEKDIYADMAVTSGGITVTPEMLVLNEKMVYLSLSVDGYYLKDGEDPCFEYVGVYLGDDPKAEDGWINMSASFYDGIISSEDGTPMYDDGTPLITDENGELVMHYTDEEGKMEYVIFAMVSEPEETLLGKTLHVTLSNLGTAYKAEVTGEIEGTWDYTFHLSDESSMEVIQMGKAVENTVFVVDSIEISPVSVKLNYTVNGDVNIYEDRNDVPNFCGVVLKDGTQLPYLSNGGMSGYTDDTLRKAYVISAFDRVIDPEQVHAILIRPDEPGAEMIEVEMKK